jgi:hypothetical protein
MLSQGLNAEAECDEALREVGSGQVWTHASQLTASYSINSSARVSNFGGTSSRN